MENGYNESILQKDLSHCYLCGRSNCKLDFHEVYSGSRRQKSKKLGLWVALCHGGCHLGSYGVHYNAETGYALKRKAQLIAMKEFCWSEDDFIREIGKSYL